MIAQFRMLIGWMVFIGLSACIGDDIIDDRVPAQLRITNPIDSLKEGDSYQLTFNFSNIIGESDPNKEATFSSSNPAIASVTNSGLITGESAGDATISVSADSEDGLLTENMQINIGAVTVVAPMVSERSGTAVTTSSYVLEGDFRLYEDGEILKLAMADNWKTTSALPGLYVYLSNNPNSNANALEISEVTIFEGAHEYVIPDGAGLNDYSHVLFYCKPFGVKVGDGPFDN